MVESCSEKRTPRDYVIKSFSYWHTFDFELKLLALPVPFRVCSHACVVARRRPSDSLQHQTVVAHDYAIRRRMHKIFALKWIKEKNVVKVPLRDVTIQYNELNTDRSGHYLTEVKNLVVN